MPETRKDEFAQKTEINRGIDDLEFRISQLSQRGMDLMGEEVRGFPSELEDGLIKYLQNIASPVCIDCGSGAGNVSKGITDAIPGARVVSFDLHPQKSGERESTTGSFRPHRLYACSNSGLGLINSPIPHQVLGRPTEAHQRADTSNKGRWFCYS